MVISNKLFTLIATIALLTTITRGQVSTDMARSATETLTKFCTMDADGVGLSADGWKQLNEMLNHPRTSRPTYAIVSPKGFNVSNARIEGNKAHFFVEYDEVAKVDDLGRFQTLPGSHHARVLYTLVIVPRKTNVPSNEDKYRSEWKIDDLQIEPRITVETARRYVTQLRDTTKSPVVRKNAERALASLRKLE